MDLLEGDTAQRLQYPEQYPLQDLFLAQHSVAGLGGLDAARRQVVQFLVAVLDRVHCLRDVFSGLRNQTGLRSILIHTRM